MFSTDRHQFGFAKKLILCAKQLFDSFFIDTTMADIQIFPPQSAEDFAEVRSLFSEYFTYLFALPNMSQYIDPLQSPFDELNELQSGKYAPPEGCILMAIFENKPIGVVALRKFGNESCEMKRLYVRPILRGQNIGQKLAQAIIEKAYQLGYRTLLLDTHGEMKKAHRLYESFGFKYIDRYNDNPVPDALFMELKLKE
ncbi:MAG: GNAT family N-acetyltransferase [Saprospiraceae bacterium]|nr:GNAT family N-acetyltransferase [Saprospiraceae bacterium]